MPVIDQEILIKPPNESIIWRYMDLDKFESILKEKGLFFCRSDKFTDPFEGSIPRINSAFRVTAEKQVAATLKRKITHEDAMNKSDNTGKLHQKFRRAFVVNCWHINQGESDAMWKLYSETKKGIAIQS